MYSLLRVNTGVKYRNSPRPERSPADEKELISILIVALRLFVNWFVISFVSLVLRLSRCPTRCHIQASTSRLFHQCIISQFLLCPFHSIFLSFVVFSVIAYIVLFFFLSFLCIFAPPPSKKCFRIPCTLYIFFLSLSLLSFVPMP